MPSVSSPLPDEGFAGKCEVPSVHPAPPLLQKHPWKLDACASPSFPLIWPVAVWGCPVAVGSSCVRAERCTPGKGLRALKVVLGFYQGLMETFGYMCSNAGA